MGGGHLAVLDRSGRETKRFPLSSGAATIGRGHTCDIRIILPAASPHHATIFMHDQKAILRSVKSGATLVNGQGVSVWRLRDGDTVTIAGRHLRWHEDNSPGKRRPTTPIHSLVHKKTSRSSRALHHVSASEHAPNKLRLELDARHRASMPATAGGKQVAVVQPQRRDNTNQNTVTSRSEDVRRASTSNLTSTATKASMWIESRKSCGGRGRGAALRLSVLKKQAVLKIQPPLTIDHTKQAALMLMAGHTKTRSPSFLVHKFASSKKSQGRKSGRGSKSISPKTPANKRTTTASFSTGKISTRGSRSVLEITDSDTPSTSRQSTISRKSTRVSPQLGSPKKSAMKQPSSNRQSRKNESIKFDLSNLENHYDSDIVTLTDTRDTSQLSDSEVSLHYSDTSTDESPSPRRSITSRSSKILKTTLGDSVNDYSQSVTRTLTPESPKARKSLRGSMIVQKALGSFKDETKLTKTLTDHSNTTVASAFRTRTLSPRKSNLESYSIVDLVSIDSNESGKNPSVYNSADSVNSSTITFGTPRNSDDRKSTRQSRLTIQSRLTLGTSLLGSSTPYVAKNNRSKRSNSSPNISSVNAKSSISTRRSKSVTTPENQNISINSTRMSRASKYRSRINDSDLLLVSPTENASPKTSRKSNKTDQSNLTIKNTTQVSNHTVTLNNSDINNSGLVTPENRHSPVEMGTPVLNIRSLLNSSQSTLSSTRSQSKRRSIAKRKTIAVCHIEPKRGRKNIKSVSLYMPARKSLRLSSDESPLPDDEVVTPTSAVKLVQEGVKNKHSTAKKPQSKRSIIDNLDESDIVKQLFSSPVKRNLSQSMTEFSRKHLSDDENDHVRKLTRNTVALTRRTLDNSLIDNSMDITEAFVSPLSTPGNSPNMSNLKRLNQKNTPDVDSVIAPRTRKSIRNDLTNISGVKNVFARSPRNRLSDVRGVKKVFAKSPNNDLRRVTGVKTLFKKQKTPKNDLTDVRGVKALFTRSSPRNDYRNVAGVKKMFANPPKNDLSDVKGVKRMYGRKRQTDYSNVSGVEDLFNESFNSQKEKSSDLFDELIGKPRIKAVYSKSFTKPQPKTTARNAKSLHTSLEVITNNVEKWLEDELQKRLNKDVGKNVSRKSRQLQLLATDTVEGEAPICNSRSRNSTITKSLLDVYSARKLPIKKRSLVENSLQKTANTSKTLKESFREKSINKSNKLPIKKRVVVHSTPVKGRYNMTMNASELGRVSPIVADKTKIAHDTSVTLSEAKQQSPKPKTPKGRKAIQKPPSIPEIASPAKVSPKKTRSKPSKSSPQVKTAVRTRRMINTTQNSVAKKRPSLVIVKKSPVAKPKSKKTSKLESTQVAVSPKKTRTTRQKQNAELTVASPKKTTRTKARRNSVVVTKPSPKMKPQSLRSKKTESKTLDISSDKNTKTRKTKTIKPAPKSTEAKSPKSKRAHKTADIKSPKPKRGQKAAEIESPKTKRSQKSVGNKSPKSKRGQKTAGLESPKTKGPQKSVGTKSPKPKRGQKTADIKSPKPKRGQKTVPIQSPKRGRVKIEESKPSPPKRGKKTTTEAPETKRGRRNAVTEKSQKNTPRSKRTQNQTTNEPLTRNSRTTRPKAESPKKTPKPKANKTQSQTSTEVETVKRGRKDIPNKTEPVTRKRRNVVEEPTPKKLVKSKSEEAVKKARGRKTEEKLNKTEVEKKSDEVKGTQTRGKRATQVTEENPKRGGRKRKSNELIDTKQAVKKPRKSSEALPAKRTTRAKKPVEDVEKPSGRSKKR